MTQTLSPIRCGPDWWLPIDDGSVEGVDPTLHADLHRHPSNVQHWTVEYTAAYGIAQEVLVDGQCTGFFVVTKELGAPDVPVHAEPPTDRLRVEASREVFGVELVRVAGALVPGREPLVDLQEVLTRPSAAGGGVVDVEPEGDPVFLLDYEALEDYQPTPHSIAQDLAEQNVEHALGLDELVEQARREAQDDGPLAGTWEEAVVNQLVRQGFVVYCSDTRLAAYRFNAIVRAYLQRQAQPASDSPPALYTTEELQHLAEHEGIANALALVRPDEIQDAALAEQWATADEALSRLESSINL